MRQLPGRRRATGRQLVPRQRLLYPFVVGTLGGLLGLLIAMEAFSLSNSGAKPSAVNGSKFCRCSSR